MRSEFTDAAWEELREATAYYDTQRPGLGDQFASEVQSAVERIQEYPNAWQFLEEGIRRCRLKRFPYGLVYHTSEGRVLILAVMHLSRAPGYWNR